MYPRAFFANVTPQTYDISNMILFNMILILFAMYYIFYIFVFFANVTPQTYDISNMILLSYDIVCDVSKGFSSDTSHIRCITHLTEC